jgi:hypothetical protein
VHADRKVPDDALGFIQRCVRERKVFWTYHVNIRLAGRYIARDDILGAVESYEIIESYPADKYLPSYLVFATAAETVFHVLFAVDVESDNVRVITAYRPNVAEWDSGLKKRRNQS